jgi:hypothetical protein
MGYSLLATLLVVEQPGLEIPVGTPSDVYRVALIAEVLQSMERDTTTASLLPQPARPGT